MKVVEEYYLAYSFAKCISVGYINAKPGLGRYATYNVFTISDSTGFIFTII